MFVVGLAGAMPGHETGSQAREPKRESNRVKAKRVGLQTAGIPEGASKNHLFS
jgi:hypothetical protein